MTDRYDDAPQCPDTLDGEQCELPLGHTGNHMSHNDDWPNQAARTAARQTTGQDERDPRHALCGVECPAVGQPNEATCTEDFRRPRCHPRHTDDCPYTDPAVGQPAEAHDTDARPSVHRWAAELYDPLADEWIPGTRYLVRDRALAALAHLRARAPKWKDGTPVERRLVRETTTWTVEDER
ncbi:hypothetical protein [Streptomyces filamentosus]|uniref:hypothetical protein n=1 Tax=Streptomyces filamentosus TaxID=67294 RepID=UPI0012390A1C|nr:hypothetical protein [Streptomyces filamentosus]KAA6216439.1 hypothetical protein CP979_05370 [Streptomyces filamentosus]